MPNAGGEPPRPARHPPATQLPLARSAPLRCSALYRAAARPLSPYARWPKTRAAREGLLSGGEAAKAVVGGCLKAWPGVLTCLGPLASPVAVVVAPWRAVGCPPRVGSPSRLQGLP